MWTGYQMEEPMTEREKMLAGELYDCGDEKPLTQWHKAKDLLTLGRILRVTDLFLCFILLRIY